MLNSNAMNGIFVHVIYNSFNDFQQLVPAQNPILRAGQSTNVTRL